MSHASRSGRKVQAGGHGKAATSRGVAKLREGLNNGGTRMRTLERFQEEAAGSE
jgi:hypothetical protein